MKNSKFVNLIGLLVHPRNPHSGIVLTLIALLTTISLLLAAPVAAASSSLAESQTVTDQSEKVIGLSSDPNGPVSSQFTALFDQKVLIPNQEFEETLWIHNQGNESAYLSVLLSSNGISSDSQALSEAITIGASIGGAAAKNTFSANDSDCTVLAAQNTPLLAAEKQLIEIELAVGNLNELAGQAATLEVNLVAVFTASPLAQNAGDLISCSGLPLEPTPEQSTPTESNSTESSPQPSQSTLTPSTSSTANDSDATYSTNPLAKTGAVLLGTLLAIFALFTAFFLITMARRKANED